MNQNRIFNWQDLKKFIYYDRVCQGGGSFFRKFFLSPVFRFTVLLRLNEFLVNKNYGIFIRFLPYLWYRRLGVRLGFSIPLNVFDYGLGIVHYGLLIVNDDAIIGKNCRIHTGVNIGGAGGFKNAGDTKRYAPTLGDNCYIGPGAKLFGPIVIGSNVAIGANAVVNKSFAEGNYTIGGIPAKIISSKSSEGLVYKL
tara:strand:- start:18297 stop:18884 length:588 start_codon:yes stop_codon:yes gene_type:complete